MYSFMFTYMTSDSLHLTETASLTSFPLCSEEVAARLLLSFVDSDLLGCQQRHMLHS